MAFHEETINNYYFEKTNGISKNRKMNGITVSYKNTPTIVYFYIDRQIPGEERFRQKIQRIFAERQLKKGLKTVHYAQNITNGDNHYEIVEWGYNYDKDKKCYIPVRNAIQKYGKVERLLRVKTIGKAKVEYEFHILLNTSP